MNKSGILLQIALCAVGIAVILLLEQYTDWDVAIQNHFYNTATGEWLITPDRHSALSPFFYKGFKIALGIFCGICLVLFGLSFRIKKLSIYRYPLILLVSCIIFAPVTVAGAKNFTNVYTPAQLAIYGGEQPHVPVLSAYPDDFVQEKKARGFPAGHSTSGFCLMGLFFCFATKWKKLTSLLTGLTLGWTTGMYQTFRGEHFISHTAVSMLAVWVVVLFIAVALNHIFKKQPALNIKEKII